MSKYTITPSYHSVKGKEIWLVKPNDKLEYSDYKKVEGKIKILGGYYSRFSRAFVFEQEPTTERLDEAFGDAATTEQKAQQAGVSASKLARIELNGKFSSVNRKTLRDEYNAGKLLVAKTGFFDGMIDGHRSIPEAEWKWSDKDNGFEKEFDYSSNPYLSGQYIVFGDYKAKYKDDIVQPVRDTKMKQTSLDYYIDIEGADAVKFNNYQIERDDSADATLQEGDPVIMSMYGRKVCGYIKKKEISRYSWTVRDLYGNINKTEDKEDVNYTVELDNGVIVKYAHFQKVNDGECDELTIPAIHLPNGLYEFPEKYWRDYIINNIHGINRMKKQKAARKKQEYAIQDQRIIDRSEQTLVQNMSTWLGWELENKSVARSISGESEAEQQYRIDKWTNEYKIAPKRLAKPKSILINKLIRANKLLLN